MSARDSSSVLPSPPRGPHIRVHTDLAELKRAPPAQDLNNTLAPIHALSPISHNAMNALNRNSTLVQDQPTPSKILNGTIRPVPADSLQLEATDEASRRGQNRSDSPTISNSTRSYGSLPATQPPLAWQNPAAVSNGLVKSISSEFGPIKQNLRSSEETSATSNGNGSLSPGGAPQWSSAVGRANLGKSGRVIERLMGENDMLKRELNIERLRAEDTKQSVKMADGKMEAMASDYEAKLHDAAINKTMLKRRERQLADVKSQVEGEKLKTLKAVEREKSWREAMERTEEESKRKVEEAQTYAALMEGRNNTMTSHWRDQEAEVGKAVTGLSKEIENLVIERRNDDEKMNRLQIVCEQQAEQLATLEKEKWVMHAAFEAYKKEQDDGLRTIKENAREKEEANEELLKQTQQVLGELKWALGVKQNVQDAR